MKVYVEVMISLLHNEKFYPSWILNLDFHKYFFSIVLTFDVCIDATPKFQNFPDLKLGVNIVYQLISVISQKK